MSVHSDILTWEISRGIKYNIPTEHILNGIAGTLSVLEYDESFTEINKVKDHAYNHAKWMRAQRDGLYGLSHIQLDKFILEVERLISS